MCVCSLQTVKLSITGPESQTVYFSFKYDFFGLSLNVFISIRFHICFLTSAVRFLKKIDVCLFE